MQQLRNIYDVASGYLDGAKTLLEVIKSLQYQKLSGLFRELSIQMVEIIERGELKINEQTVHLSPHFKHYFPNETKDYIVDPLEPLLIVRIKKLLGILTHFEHIFSQIEKLNTGASDPNSTYDRLMLLQPSLLRALNTLLNDIHSLFHEIFDFGLDVDSLFHEASLHHLIGQIFRFAHAPEQEERLLSSIDRFTASIAAVPTFRPKELAKQTGNVLGHLMYMMSAGDEKFQFLSHLLNDVPSVLQSLQEFIQKHLDVMDLHTSMTELHLLEDKTRDALKGIGFLNDLSLRNALNVVMIISHIRSMISLLHHYSSSLGHIHLDLQKSLKAKLSELKFNYLLPLVIALDELELDLMLAPGELTLKTLPMLEQSYATVVGFLADKISFSLVDASLVNLIDSKWDDMRLDASYRRKSRIVANQERLHRLQIYLRSTSDIQGFKQRFYALKDYFIQADENWFNQALQALQAGQKPATIEAHTLEKLQLLFTQAQNNLEFKARRLDSSHQYLLNLRHQFLNYLRLESPPESHSMRTRLWFQTTLIDDGKQFYFYHGHNQTLTSLPAFTFTPASKFGFNQLQKLNSDDFIRVSALMQAMLKHPNWFVHHLSTENWSSDENLGDIVEFYQSRLKKSQWAKTLMVELHNFIWTLRCPRGAAYLSPENTEALLLKFFQAGPWMGDEVVEFCELLLDYRVRLTSLQDWAETKLIALIDIYHQYLEVYQQQFDQFMQLQVRHEEGENLRQFAQLEVLPRSEFLLRSTRYSAFFQSLQEKIEGLKPYYAQAMRAKLDCPLGHYQDLLKAPVFLATAQQTLEFQLVLNALHYLRCFSSQLEQCKACDLEPSYSTLGFKIAITTSYLNVQAYFVPGGLSWKYHQASLAQAWQALGSFINHPITELSQYELYDEKGDLASGLDQVLHWILNGDEIFKDMVAPHTLERDFKSRLQQQTHQTMKKIKTILSASHYWSLLAKTFNIFGYMREIKQRFNRLVQEIYQVNHQNLPKIKQLFFGELLEVADQLELKLGLNPEFFSEQLVEMTNLIFAHYLRAMMLDPLLSVKLLLNDGLDRNRLEVLMRRQEKNQDEIVKREYQKKQLRAFIRDFALHHSSNPDFPAALKELFIHHVYPVLQELLPQYRFAVPQAFLSDQQKQTDALFQAWVNTTATPLIAHDYENLIQHAESYLQGWINTLTLEQDLLTEKKQFLDIRMRRMVEDQTMVFVSVIQNFYVDRLQQIEKQRKPHFRYLSESYFACLRNALSFSQTPLTEWTQSLDELMKTPWSFNPQVPAMQGPIQATIDAYIVKHLQSFDQKTTRSYLLVDGILSLIKQYQAYLQDNPRHLEVMHLIPEKLRLLNLMEVLCMSEEMPIEQRLISIQSIIQDRSFVQEMKNFGRDNHHGLMNFILACWQGILNLMSYFGVSFQAQKPLVYLRQMEKLSRGSSISSLSMYAKSFSINSGHQMFYAIDMSR